MEAELPIDAESDQPPPRAGSRRRPSASWLRDALAAERASVAALLEKRHEDLLHELVSMDSLELDHPDHRERILMDHLDEPYGDAGEGSPTAACETGASAPVSSSGRRLEEERPKGDVGEGEHSAGLPIAPSESISREISRRSNSSKQKLKKTLGIHRDHEYMTSASWTVRLVHHPLFEIGVASLIMLNVCVMALQIQYDGFNYGLTLEYPGYNAPKQDIWPHAEVAFEVVDYFFGILYCSELILKIHALRCTWLLDPWNYFDLVIIVCWLLETTFKDVLTLPADATALRAARLFKLLRLVKVIKTLNGFDSLYLLVTTLKGSVQILGWSCALLVVVQMLISFSMCILLSFTYFDNDDYPIQERRDIFEYFGTFSRAMLSMFELTLANWPPICRALVEKVNEWFMLFFVIHKLTVGFAVIGVINGVFMQETFKLASTDDSILMRQRDRDVRVYGEKMRRLFEAADQDGDGGVTVEEFGQVVQDPEIMKWMSSLELPVRDHRDLFMLIDDNCDGDLSFEELVKGMLRLRGNAKSVDVISLKKIILDQQRMMADVADMQRMERS